MNTEFLLAAIALAVSLSLAVVFFRLRMEFENERERRTRALIGEIRAYADAAAASLENVGRRV